MPAAKNSPEWGEAIRVGEVMEDLRCGQCVGERFVGFLLTIEAGLLWVDAPRLALAVTGRTREPVPWDAAPEHSPRFFSVLAPEVL